MTLGKDEEHRCQVFLLCEHFPTNKEGKTVSIGLVFYCKITLTMLNLDISCFKNSVDPDQLASNWLIR